MRWFAAASISVTVLGAVFGCGSDAAGPYIPPDGDGGTAGESTAGSGGVATAGKSGGSAGKSGAASAGAAGEVEAGSTNEGGSAGAEESGGAPAGGTGGTAGSGGSGGTAPVPTVPSAPTTLDLQILSATSVQLGWADTAGNETGFYVYWSATAEKPAQPNATLEANVVIAKAEGLTANQEYNFWVEAFNDVGKSSVITGKATPMPVPAQPTGLVVTGGASDASLTWTDAATGETSYRVYWSPTNMMAEAAVQDLPANSNSFTVPGAQITPYTLYYYWVVAINAVGASAAATGTATTGVAPVSPTLVTVYPKESVWYVKVQWVDNSTTTSSYNIYWSTDDTKPTQPGATVDGSALSYKVTEKKCDQTYRFWVESVNAIGKSAATKGTATQKTDELAWNQLYFDISNNTIRHSIFDTFNNLDADPTTGLYGYHTPNALLGTASALGPSINWNPTSAGIDMSVTQYFWSEARTPLGSQYSVRSLVPPGLVTNLASSNVTNISATLAWTAATSSSTYQWFRALNSNLFANATSLGTVNSVSNNITGLNPGIAYTYWVRALGAGMGGPGMPSPTVQTTFTTTGTPIGANLALNKTAVASSDTGNAKNVVDGNIGSRWQAATKNTTEWIYVNLGDGNAKSITDVKLVWEAAYASSYDIQVCAATCDDSAAAVDTWPWVTAYNGPTVLLTAFPNYQLVHLPMPYAVGQFVRMKPKTLGNNFGASLYEFEVYSAP